MTDNLYTSHPLMQERPAKPCHGCKCDTKNPSGICSRCWHTMCIKALFDIKKYHSLPRV